MNCSFEFSEPDENGVRLAKCRRIGCSRRAIKVPATSGTNVQARCNGIPLAGEWQEIVALLAESLLLDKPAAICRYVRWRMAGSKLAELSPEIPKPMLAPVNQGPGTELHKLLAELGITPDASCNCESMRQQMNRWGSAGCREHKAELVAHLREAYQQTDWLTVLKAGGLAAAKGLPLTIEGIVLLSIERASAKIDGHHSAVN